MSILSENALGSEDKDHVGAFSHSYRISNEDYFSPRDAPSKILGAYACQFVRQTVASLSLPRISGAESCSLSVVFFFYHSAPLDSLPAH